MESLWNFIRHHTEQSVARDTHDGWCLMGALMHPCTETNAWHCSGRDYIRTVKQQHLHAVLQLWALIAFGACKCMGFWPLALPHVWPALKVLFRLFWILKLTGRYCHTPLLCSVCAVARGLSAWLLLCLRLSASATACNTGRELQPFRQ